MFLSTDAARGQIPAHFVCWSWTVIRWRCLQFKRSHRRSRVGEVEGREGGVGGGSGGHGRRGMGERLVHVVYESRCGSSGRTEQEMKWGVLGAGSVHERDVQTGRVGGSVGMVKVRQPEK